VNILFLGHSLIEYFDWQERFPLHCVVNLSVSGESVEGLLARIHKIPARYAQADLIFIMTGINNIAMDDLDFFDSYRKIIQYLSKAYPEGKIYIHSILPVLVDFISNDTIRKVNDSLFKLSKETGAGYIDIFKLFLDRDGKPIREYLLDDGVHLSSKGYAVWSDFIENVIVEEEKKLSQRQ
jgi:lysophospholipase L1-like esterase